MGSVVFQETKESSFHREQRNLCSVLGIHWCLFVIVFNLCLCLCFTFACVSPLLVFHLCLCFTCACAKTLS